MRRLYVSTLATYLASKDAFDRSISSYWIGLIDMTKSTWESDWAAAESPVIISTQFSVEVHEDIFHADPTVTVLPHPVAESWIQLGNVMAMTNNLGNSHNGVACLNTASWLPISAQSTILDIHAAIAPMHSGFKLRL